MSGNEVAQDEIVLFGLWEKLRDGWRYVLGGSVLGLVGVGSVITLLPPQYEAVALLEVAQVGQIGQPPLRVESPERTIARMNAAPFQLAVAERLGDKKWIKELQLSGTTPRGQHIKVQLAKSDPALIDLRSYGDSAVSARNVAEEAIRQLASRQTEIAKPMLDQMRTNLSIAREDLAIAENDLKALNRTLKATAIRDSIQFSFITSWLLQKEAQVVSLRQTAVAYDTALTAPITHPARAVDGVFVANNPLSQRGLLLNIGLPGGLLIGALAAILVGTWRQATRGPAKRV